MEDLLSGMQQPITIGLIIAAVLALVAIVLLARRLRNRQGPPGAGDAQSLGGPVDYTSLPLDEEPRGWRDRFARLSLAGKILAVLVPLLAILGLLALVLTLLPPAEPPVAGPPPVAVTLQVDDAAVIRAEPLTVDINVTTTGIADGTRIAAQMLEDGEPFAWLNPELAVGVVRNDRAELQATQAAGAPTATEGRSYTIVVSSPDGQFVSEPTELVVPAISGIADRFFGRAAPVAAASTPTTASTLTPAATAATTPEPTTTPAPALPEGPAASVRNGGNVRSLPLRAADNVLGGVNAGEQVQLLERTPNGEWYRVRTVRDELGWVSASLISVPADANIPVANVVTVFVNGPLYERADTASTEVDRVNQNEVVQLLQRTAASDWYQVTNVRQITGWVPANLLGIPADVAATVPVAP